MGWKCCRTPASPSSAPDDSWKQNQGHIIWFWEQNHFSCQAGSLKQAHKPHLRLSQTLRGPWSPCPCPELRLQLSPPSLPDHCQALNHPVLQTKPSLPSRRRCCRDLINDPCVPRWESHVTLRCYHSQCSEQGLLPAEAQLPSLLLPSHCCLPLPASSSICVVKCGKQLFFLFFFFKSWVLSGSAL